MAPRNRKERRAAAASHTDQFDPSSIPLARPPARDFASQQNAKTLLEIAAERREATGKTEPEFIHVSPSGEILGTEKLASKPGPSAPSSRITEVENDPQTIEDDNAAIPPFADTIFLSLPLSALYFTLSFLAAHQYAQETPLKKLIQKAVFIAFPVLTFLIHLAHGHIVSFQLFSHFYNRSILKNRKNPENTEPGLLRTLFPLTSRNLLFCSLAIISGMHLIATANEGSYYAVMKKTPAIGTLWVLCVLEISAGFAALSLLVPVVWAVGLKDYKIL